METALTAKALMLKVKQALLVAYEANEAQSIAFELLEKKYGISKTAVVLDETVSALNDQELAELIQRLVKHEPIQHVTGIADFYDLSFQVNAHVLIPRPETEELVDLIIREQPKATPFQLLDIGTGSGCIPISIKKNLPQATVSAIDISSAALAVAKKNAAINQVDIQFYQKDILTEDLRNFPTIDVMVSNPPYVRALEKAMMQANVLNYEPHLALFVPNSNPLLFYQRIASLAIHTLSHLGKLYFEINEAFGLECKLMMEKVGFKEVVIIQDFYGKDRIVKGIKDESKLT